MQKTRKPDLRDVPDTAMRLMGIDHNGRAVWVRNFAPTQGITVTENPEEPMVFRDHGDLRVAFSHVIKENKLRNVAVQFVRAR